MARLTSECALKAIEFIGCTQRSTACTINSTSRGTVTAVTSTLLRRSQEVAAAAAAVEGPLCTVCRLCSFLRVSLMHLINLADQQ